MTFAFKRPKASGPAGLKRPEAAGPVVKVKLIPELVPSTSWFTNLRSMLPSGQWDVIRKAVYVKCGYKCEVCGGVGKRHPVECHETWEYDERRGIQKLVGLIGLCPSCHEVKHIGLAEMNGRLVDAMQHMRRVNGMTKVEASEAVDDAFRKWELRSEREWKLDISWLKGWMSKLGG